MRARSGGSRYSSMTCFLERELACPAIIFPMASNGDGAHQPNESISLVNLFKGREVFERVLGELTDSGVA